MRKDMNCPYCDAIQSVRHDDGHGYAEDTLHEHTCTNCEKEFVFTTTIQAKHRADKRTIIWVVAK